MTEGSEKVELLAQPEAQLWGGERFLQVVGGQLKGQNLPYAKYPQVIEFRKDNPIVQGFRMMEEEQASRIQQIAKDPSLKDYAFYENHLQLYHKKRGGWQLGKILPGGRGFVFGTFVDEDMDPDFLELAIHFHTHGFHPQITRFFSADDLRTLLRKRHHFVESIIMPGMNFVAIATEDTPQLTKEEIEEQLTIKDPVKFKKDLAKISKRLMEIGRNNKADNIFSKKTLPRVRIRRPLFDKKLSEYGVSLINYIITLRIANKLKLAIYCAKTGSNRFVKIDEDFNPDILF